MSGGFVWDDDDYVQDNLTLRSLAGLGQIWFQPGHLVRCVLPECGLGLSRYEEARRPRWYGSTATFTR